ncbi:MAG: metallophosphoesterase, partial [Paracoccus sp. (in: a-proteobacteria)]
MTGYGFDFDGQRLEARPSGALFWPAESMLVVADLHLGKCARQSEYGGAALPPYDSADTLARLHRDIAATAPDAVVCLGDSLDSPGIGAALPTTVRAALRGLATG